MNIPKLIELPKILDKRGNLSFFENSNQLPFDIKRAYWLYDIPGGKNRGSHAFKNANEFIIALSGSFDVIVNNGIKETSYSLNKSNIGVFIPKKHWRSLENFSTNTIGLIVSSMEYSESDYIRNYKDFKDFINDK